MTIADLFREIVSILRYLAAPWVGLLVAWLVDDGHDIVRVAAKAASSWVMLPFPWLLVALLALVGVVVYFAHRILLHHGIAWILVRHATRNESPRPTVYDLAFARWERRGAPQHSSKKSVQSALDEANAASHFFYCSGWASLLMTGLFKLAFSNVLSFVGIVSVFLVIGFVGDYQTTKRDLQVYKKYGGNDNV